MRKLLFLTLLVASTVAFANLVEFKSQDQIKAADVNFNFNYIKSILSAKNIQINFSTFTSGELILKETFETEFEKLRLLGIEITALSSEKIKSIELNQAFIQSKNGALSYDDLPTAFGALISINEDTSIGGIFSYNNIVGNASIEITTMPLYGTLTTNGFNYTYNPNLNYFGNDSFSFRVFDGSNYSESALTNINVIPVNDVPLAVSQNITTNEDTSLNITLTGNDVENSSLTYTILTSPSNGTLTGEGPNKIYTPNPNYFGTDFFTFKVNDGELDSSVATISITISAVNDIPSISGSSISTSINASSVSGSISVADIDSASFSYIVVTPPTKGSFSFTSGGSYSYTPSLNQYGSDSIVVKINDGQSDSNLLTIPVTITGSGIISSSSIRMYFDGTYATSCNAYKTNSTFPKTYTGSTGNGVYRIQSGADVADVYCEMDASGGGWTLVAFNNGNPGLANMPSNFLASVRNANGMLNINAANTASSLNLERMSSFINSKDIMLIATAYGGSFNPLIELNAGLWSYNTTKCSGTFRRTSRTAGCSGQNANDNYNGADALNFSFNNGAEGIVPSWLNAGNELCYSGKGWCSFKIFFR